MIKNYFRIAFRTISRNRLYTVINVLGLALGLCSCIVIFLMTRFDLSFDKFHEDSNRIYRIVGEIQEPTGQKIFLNCPIPDVAGFQNQIPGFEATAGFHLYPPGIKVVDGQGQEKKFDFHMEGSYGTTVIFTWPEYFNIFKYQWLTGDPKVLSQPFQLVLSEKRGKKYFGDISAAQMLGKKVIYDDSLQLTVAGIVKDWEGNTDFGFTDFVSYSTATHSFIKSQIGTDDWSSLSPHQSMAFVKLSTSSNPEQINQRFARYISRNVKNIPAGAKLSMWLQPLSEIHFTPDFRRGDDGDDFRKAYLPMQYALLGLALFILLIAAVNFINLSTAQSLQRAKEIGIRKVMGGNKSTITFQFLAETFVLVLISVCLAIILVRPALNLLSEFIPAGIIFNPFESQTVVFVILLSLLATLLAGYYPARVLASYLPSISLKGVGAPGSSGKFFVRKGLIVFQFTISLVFIISAIVIANQIRFMRKADKGFSTDAIVTLNTWGDRKAKTGILAEKIKHIPGIEKVILQGNSPMGFAHAGTGAIFKEKNINLDVTIQEGNEDFISFYKMKLIAGRNIFHSDSLQEVVVNETLTKALGFSKPEDAVGKVVTLSNRDCPIVGVVADFMQDSFHEKVKPLAIGKWPELEKSIAIKLQSKGKESEQIKPVITAIEKAWNEIYPNTPFNYSFLDESITWLFGPETTTAHLVNGAMVVTIFISCMGLFGLSMFMAGRRTKEIGIRKVLGASVASITQMLSRDFAKLILIAILIASPIAWLLANNWLQDFAYRIHVSWWIFLLAGAGAILIALLTVGYHAIKAAIANPVKSLRTE
ncbi:MAG: hypothetical protein C5B52_13740 [Bacteroidetes bacterium]|nr:MAG: hypothetical protein C5B52_13740 [Bacteroidota bacterium]